MRPAWASSPTDFREIRIPADRPVWFVSDLHLGDGSASDAFMGKDRLLLALLDEVDAERGTLVIVGDAVDLLQAHDFTPVVRAHGKLLRRLSDLAGDGRCIYLHGNHDHDMRMYQDLLRFDVAARLWIGDDVVVMHGHQFDPWIGEDVLSAGLATRMHHGLEKLLGTWFRLPLHDFYSPGNRVFLWTAYRAWQLLKARNWVLRRVGLGAMAARSEAFTTFWSKNDAGDPMGIARPALAWARTHGAKAVVCGHSHMPGNVEEGGARYINTGSWTFHWAQATRYADGAFTVRDRVTGRTYGDELYRPLMSGELDHVTFDRWWRNQYLGWFRFRTAELRQRYGTAR